MSNFEFDVKARESDNIPFMVIYGGSGLGKTTLANQAPDNVFIQTEDGAGELSLNTMKDGVFTSFDEIMAALTWINRNPKGIKTIVIDSLDHLEPLVWKHVCEQQDPPWPSIEFPGYGKGYIEAEAVWLRLINALLRIRDRHGITIIGIAHELVRTINDPLYGVYDAHEMKMNKKAVALWKEKCNMIGLLKNVVSVDEKKRTAKGGTTPTLFVRPNAAYTAKTRYRKMPSSIQIPLVGGWDKIAKYIPWYNTDQTTEEIDTTEEETD